MAGNEKPLLTVGEVLDLAENDYRYGTGRLRIRVDAVPVATPQADPEWLQVGGVQLRWDGSDGQHRTVMVRVAALRRRRSKQ